MCSVVIGQRFGNYRALSLLGEGGMGAVYLAEHPEIGRRVAVKVLRPELIKDPLLLTRFLNEARAANAIRHPNIIEILDSGTTPEGTPYLVMELLEGEALSARIKRLGRLPLKDALEFAYQAASALAAAHGKAIVHRDLKPDNLFVIRDPNNPERELIKVLDFGIAKLQTLSIGAGMQTRTGTLMGTPVYMSPEQCLGTKTVDHRSDIYSMGIILFEMLAGRPPFLSEGFGELVNMHLNVRPPPLRDINRTVTQSVEALVAKALEKVPDARQRSATELQQDIRAAAGDIPIHGTSSSDLLASTMPGGLVGGGTRVMASSTTMSAATGERFVSTVLTPKSRLPMIAAVLGGVLALGTAGYFARARFRTPEGTAALSSRKTTVTEPAGRTVADGTKAVKAATIAHVRFESEPSGAAVTDAVTGAVLGTTPFTLQRPASPTPVRVRVELAGFAGVTQPIDVDRDRVETLSLAPLPTTPAKVETPGGHTSDRVNDKTKKAGAHPHKVVPTLTDEPAKL